MRFAIYDYHKGGYARPSYGKVTPGLDKAKIYKRLAAAVELASLMNTPRNIPPGHSGPSKHYQNLPNAVVHKLDDLGEVVEVIPAPPVYLEVDTAKDTVSIAK